MKLNRSSVVVFLLTLQVLLIGAIVALWLADPTYRVYLEDRTDDGKQGNAWQHFVVENGSVVPQIITRNDALTAFEINPANISTLRFRATPTGPAAYEIYLIRNGVRRLLLKTELTGSVSNSVSLPAGRESVEIDNHGAITWSDLRVVSGIRLLPYLGAWAFLILLTGSIKRGAPVPDGFMRAGLMLGSIFMTLLIVEIGMQLLREQLPYSVADARHDLGTFRLDPRWQLTARFGKRLRPNSDTFTLWEYGDLVRMAVIPADVSHVTVSRYPVRTDSEGFRNASTRERIAVAALGDSFTDALMVPAEQAWPQRLERILGIPVQNYGVAGFGPQQELYVLQDYAIHHQPRVVVVAYFAGNDIFDAESFAKFEQARTGTPEIPGWKIKKKVLRIQALYIYTLASMVGEEMWRHSVKKKGAPTEPAAGEPKPDAASQARPELVPMAAESLPPSHAYFDRGMFRVPIRGHTMSFAFMPSYLRTLNYSKAWLEATPGWALTRKGYQEMKRTADEHGATLVVMFIPFKAQVYVPMLQRLFSAEVLNRNFRFYFRENQADADVKTMAKNRLAQNEMMRGLCEKTGALFLDLTSSIQDQIERGDTLYFPDDAHWNAAGQELAARELAEFLRQHQLDRQGH